MSEGFSTFTAAQIATKLGVRRQSVQRQMQGVAPTATIIAAGNEAKAWALSSLPYPLVVRLDAEAKQRGCRDVEQLLSDDLKPWMPPLPLDQVQERFKESAMRLREAMTLPIQRQHELKDSDLTELGLTEFKRVFGYAVSARRWNRLFDQVMDRDRGFGDFQRVELYLDRAAFEKTIPERGTLKFKGLHSALDEFVAALEDKANPTADDRAWLFDEAFRHYDRLIAEHAEKRAQRGIKNSLINYLVSAVPGLSKTPKALRRVFEMNLVKWRAGGCRDAAIMDRRRMDSGNFRRPDFAEDQKTISAYAVRFGGNESLAHRYCREKGLLSRQFVEYYAFNIRTRKSAVPAAIRDEITPTVDSCEPIHHGEWEAKMRGPYIPRDWDDVTPGEYYTADDMTSNNRICLPGGEVVDMLVSRKLEDGRYDILRPDGVFHFDFACDYPVGHVITTGRISGCLVKNALNHIHDNPGLPRRGVWYENSVFSSRFIQGEKQPGNGTPTHWRTLENGFSALNPPLEVHHHQPRNPRAKPAESIFRRVQERMRLERGFIGFNERLDRMERIQEFIVRVKSGKEDPRNELYTLEEWSRCIDRIMEEFANEPQNGKRLKGRSPAEAWQESILKNPLRKLPEEARYLLSTHKKIVTVHQHGILLTIGNQRLLYCNERTGQLIGRKVIAWYSLECPDLLTVSDLDQTKFFSVKRIHLPALNATKDQFAEVKSQIKGHNRAVQTVYSNLNHRVVSTITRDNAHDETTKDLGRFHNEEIAAFKAEQSQNQRTLRKIQVDAAAAGTRLNPEIRNPDRVKEGLDRERAILDRLKAKALNPTESTAA